MENNNQKKKKTGSGSGQRRKKNPKASNGEQHLKKNDTGSSEKPQNQKKKNSSNSSEKPQNQKKNKQQSRQKKNNQPSSEKPQNRQKQSKQQSRQKKNDPPKKNPPNQKKKKGSSSSGKYQKIMADKKIRFVSDRDQSFVHDKACPAAKKIPDQYLRYYRNYPMHLKPCPECAKSAYIRNGARDFENYDRYVELYEDMNVDLSLLYHMYISCKAQTSVAPNRLYIAVEEDHWIIERIDNKGGVCLMHNNYRVHDGIRIFETGYHIQNDWLEDTTFFRAFHYIEEYHWTPNHMESHIDNDHDADHRAADVPAAAGHDQKVDAIVSEINESHSIFSRLKKMFFREDEDKTKVSAMADSRNSADHSNQPQNVYHLHVTGFQIPSRSGYPRDGQRCIYVWKNKEGELNWQIGLYQSRPGRFEVVFGEKRIFCNKRDILAWKYVTDINVEWEQA